MRLLREGREDTRDGVSRNAYLWLMTSTITIRR